MIYSLHVECKRCTSKHFYLFEIIKKYLMFYYQFQNMAVFIWTLMR